jgi:flagella basal body P-ring formation protein FlgA
MFLEDTSRNGQTHSMRLHERSAKCAQPTQTISTESHLQRNIKVLLNRADEQYRYIQVLLREYHTLVEEMSLLKSSKSETAHDVRFRHITAADVGNFMRIEAEP